MRKVLQFKTIAFDTLNFAGRQETSPGIPFELFGEYDGIAGDVVTNESESNILKWLMASVGRNLILDELGVKNDSFVGHDVVKPVIDNPQVKPGDIDLLICDDYDPYRAIAIQFKRVKVTALGTERDRVNKLSDVADAVRQANLQRSNLGFHRNYLGVIIESLGKERSENNVVHRGPNQRTFRAVYDFPQRESLHENVGVIFIIISQPTEKTFQHMAVVGVCVDREAARLEQTSSLANRLNALMNQRRR